MLVVSPRNFTRPSLVVFLIATFIQKFSYSELKLFPLRKFEKVQLKEAWLYRKFNRKFSSDQMENHCFFCIHAISLAIHKNWLLSLNRSEAETDKKKNRKFG